MSCKAYKLLSSLNVRDEPNQKDRGRWSDQSWRRTLLRISLVSQTQLFHRENQTQPCVWRNLDSTWLGVDSGSLFWVRDFYINFVYIGMPLLFSNSELHCFSSRGLICFFVVRLVIKFTYLPIKHSIKKQEYSYSSTSMTRRLWGSRRILLDQQYNLSSMFILKK